MTKYEKYITEIEVVISEKRNYKSSLKSFKHTTKPRESKSPGS